MRVGLDRTLGQVQQVCDLMDGEVREKPQSHHLALTFRQLQQQALNVQSLYRRLVVRRLCHDDG